MERCPICRARWKEQTVCRRCGADLANVLAVADRAETLNQRAIHHFLRDTDPRTAIRLVRHAAFVHDTPLNRILPDFFRDQAADFLDETASNGPS